MPNLTGVKGFFLLRLKKKRSKLHLIYSRKTHILHMCSLVLILLQWNALYNKNRRNDVIWDVL